MRTRLQTLSYFLIIMSCLIFTTWGREAITPDFLVIYPEENGITARAKLIELIRSATTKIDMAAYQMKDPQVSDALRESAGKGVKVRLILEENSYKHVFNADETQDTLLPQLTDAGIVVHGRPENLKAAHPDGHYHARYFIIDGKTFVLTTGNFDRSTFFYCRDFATVIRKNAENKSEFEVLENVFEGDWNNEPITVPSSLPSIILGPNNQRKEIIEYLKKTKDTLDLYQQYCNDPEISGELVKLKNSGVKIRIMMMANPSGYEKDPNENTQDKLASEGIEVKLVDIDKVTYIHGRAIIRDGTVALTGTAQLSKPSLEDNRELSIVINGSAVEKIKAKFEEDWAVGLDLEKGRHKARSVEFDWNKAWRDAYGQSSSKN